jgi:hypothetical protein
MPSRRVLPFAFGIDTVRTGTGSKLRSFTCDRSSVKNPATPC